MNPSHRQAKLARTSQISANFLKDSTGHSRLVVLNEATLKAFQFTNGVFIEDGQRVWAGRATAAVGAVVAHAPLP
jgi:hypothetical protein